MQPKIHICGKNQLHIPDDDCSECMKALNEFKQYVQENYYPKTEVYTKTEVNELIAGISISGGGFKLVDTLPATGEAGYIYLVPNTPPETGYEQYIWTDSGWADLGREQLTLDKQSILTALGYEEIAVTMTDLNDADYSKTFLTSVE